MIERSGKSVVARLGFSEAAKIEDAVFRAHVRGELFDAFMASDLDSADLLVELHDGTVVDTGDWA